MIKRWTDTGENKEGNFLKLISYQVSFVLTFQCALWFNWYYQELIQKSVWLKDRRKQRETFKEMMSITQTKMWCSSKQWNGKKKDRINWSYPIHNNVMISLFCLLQRKLHIKKDYDFFFGLKNLNYQETYPNKHSFGCYEEWIVR